jgi:hypothetical protein
MMAGGTFGGGDGTKSSPYIIVDTLDLAELGKPTSDGLYFEFGNDIDFGGVVWSNITVVNPRLNGKGYSIVNLVMDREQQYGAGLFHTVYMDSTQHTDPYYIANITFVATHLTTRAGVDVAGILAGYINPDIRVQNIRVLDAVIYDTGKTLAVGGIVGSMGQHTFDDGINFESNQHSGGPIDCLFQGQIYIDDSAGDSRTVDRSGQEMAKRVGGIIGHAEINMINCEALGSIDMTSNDYHYTIVDIGGAIGYYGSSPTKIMGSRADVAITANIDISVNGSITRSIGGFVGFSTSNVITTSYAKGNIIFNHNDRMDVTGAQGVGAVGGFMGYATGVSSITDCYCNLDINLQGRTIIEGGFVGLEEYSNEDAINHCYEITTTGIAGDPTIERWGWAKSLYSGQGTGHPVNLYTNQDVNGEPPTGTYTYIDYPTVRATGYYREDMKNQANYIDFDFETIWVMDEVTGFPTIDLRNYQYQKPLVTTEDMYLEAPYNNTYNMTIDGENFNAVYPYNQVQNVPTTIGDTEYTSPSHKTINNKDCRLIGVQIRWKEKYGAFSGVEVYLDSIFTINIEGWTDYTLDFIYDSTGLVLPTIEYLDALRIATNSGNKALVVVPYDAISEDFAISTPDGTRYELRQGQYSNRLRTMIYDNGIILMSPTDVTDSGLAIKTTNGKMYIYAVPY